MNQWQLQEAKAKFSEVVRAALSEPQEISVRGTPAAVILSRKAYDRLAKRSGSFVKFVRKSPMAGADLTVDRDRSPARSVRL